MRQITVLNGWNLRINDIDELASQIKYNRREPAKDSFIFIIGVFDDTA